MIPGVLATLFTAASLALILLLPNSEDRLRRHIQRQRGTSLDRQSAGLMPHPLAARLRRTGGKSRGGIPFAGRVPALRADGR